MAGNSRGRELRAFRSLVGNRALLRVLAAYLLFNLSEYAVWIAMLVFAYSRGGAAVAGLVAVAQLVPAAVVAPVAASLADRRSPVILLAGGYLAPAAAMAGIAAAVTARAPLAAYAAAVIASTAVTTTRPAQSTILPSIAATPDQLTVIDTRLIRTMGPGDHFGELAARDWGGGSGYARTATVRCAEPGRLLKLTSEDLQWLIDTEPTVKAKLASTLAERLQQR